MDLVADRAQVRDRECVRPQIGKLRKRWKSRPVGRMALCISTANRIEMARAAA